MNENWFHDAASSATNAAIALLGSVLVFAAVVSAILGLDLTAAWLIVSAVGCVAVVFGLMYAKAARERDALVHAAVSSLDGLTAERRASDPDAIDADSVTV
jgi:uncharacterized membrane protein